MFDRRTLLTVLTMLPVAGAAYGHHGWSWAEDVVFDLTGVIKSAQLGNPHGVLKEISEVGHSNLLRCTI